MNARSALAATAALLLALAAAPRASALTMAGSATIEANGGALTLTTPIVQAGPCDRTLTLTGSSTALNTLPTAIGDPSSSGKTSLRKAGAGTWRLSGTSSYLGTTHIVAGKILAAGDAQYNGNGVFGYSSNGFDDAGGFIEVDAGCTVLLTQGVSFARYLRAAGGATLGAP
jgi:autotransporter-associated beta strand protein